MRPLRVMHVVESLGLGGIERVVQGLARHADRRRFDLRVTCTSRGGPLARAIEEEGTPVRILGLRAYYPWDLAAAARWLAREAPDIVHSHGHFAGVVARCAAFCARVPVAVHHLHTIDTGLRGRHRRLERVLARVTHRILCCSHAVLSHATQTVGLPRALLLAIPNGIDPAPPGGRAEAIRLLGDVTGPLVGCLGQIATHKGQETLLRACALLALERTPPTVVLIGDGPDRARLERMAGEAGIASRVVFLGERLDARRLLPALDLVVVPSIAREGLGLATLEAMDAGRPVVASRVGGLVEVVEEGRTGLLVPPGDPIALASAIRSVLERPDRGRGLGEAGRLRVEAEFRAAVMARRVLAVYEEAFDERRAA